MSSEESSTFTTSASSDFTPQSIGGTAGPQRGRGRGRGGRARGSGGRARGRGRGRGRGRAQRPRLYDDMHLQHIQEAQQRRISELKTKLQSLTTAQKDMILETVVNRSPGLLMDVMAFFEVPPGPEPEDQPGPTGQPQWCVCGHCREMPTPEELICCRQRSEDCISRMGYMDCYILDEGVLRLARAAWNDIFAIDDEALPGVDQRQFRHGAYRQYVLWQHGRLGVGNRVVIPSCCVLRIREKFPDPTGHYTGYRVRRLL